MTDAAETQKTDLKRAGPAWVLGVLWATAPAISGILLLSHIGLASDWLNSHPDGAFAIYVGLFIISAGCGLLPTYAQSILGGWVFGLTLGVIGALAGFAGGAIIGYGITRVVAQDRIERMIRDNRKARAVRDALIGHGFWWTLWIVILLRISPSSPFALTNLAMSSTGVRFVPYVAGTIIGMAPRTAVAVWLAATAASTGADDIQELVSDKGVWHLIAGIAILLVVAMIIGAIAKRALERVPPADN